MTMTNELGFTPFADRAVEFLGVREAGNTRLKTYAVVYANRALDTPRFEQGLALAAGELPEPDPSMGRPGVGFVILHQGKTGDYVVLCWWDRENELPTRVFVWDQDYWRPALPNESFCVWDLDIIGSERNAYLETVLCHEGASLDAYLSNASS